MYSRFRPVLHLSAPAKLGHGRRGISRRIATPLFRDATSFTTRSRHMRTGVGADTPSLLDRKHHVLQERIVAPDLWIEEPTMLVVRECGSQVLLRPLQSRGHP